PNLEKGTISVVSRVSHQVIWYGRPDVRNDPKGYSSDAVALFSYLETHQNERIEFPLWEPEPKQTTLNNLKVYMVSDQDFPNKVLMTAFNKMIMQGKIKSVSTE
ncbi:MAG: hypothetical protein QW303_01395, partial [Nitrososphaerota archaeon]